MDKGYKYEFDQTMIDEMLLFMNNNEHFYDAIETALNVYQIDFNYPSSAIAHAANYARDIFDYYYCRDWSDYYLQAEYYKAADIFIREYIDEYINDKHPKS